MYDESDVIQLCEAAYQAGYMEGGRYGVLPVVTPEDKYYKIYKQMYMKWATQDRKLFKNEKEMNDFILYAKRAFSNY